MENFGKIEKIIKGKEAKVFERDNFERGLKENLPEDKRLSENEALLYQKYATRKEGVAFGKKTNIDTYVEAEKFIQKLKETEFDWLNIDWEKVNFKLESLSDIENRLDYAVRLLNQKEDPESKKSISRYLSNLKGVILPFALSAAIMLSRSGDVFSADFKKDFQANISKIEKTEIEKDSKIKTNDDKFYNTLKRWKDKHGNVDEVILDTDYEIIIDEKEGIAGTKIKQKGVRGYATVIVKLKSGENKTCRGSSRTPDTYTPLFSELVESIRRALEKIGISESDTEDYRIIIMEVDAVQDALNKCDQLIK